MSPDLPGRHLTSEARVPDPASTVERRATYRVQLNPGFAFEDASRITGYLARLGVSHLYCSPYLQASSGSSHGYDVVDPQHINDELGGEPGLALLAGELRRAGIGQLLDIVPNHMAADPTANGWWRDVLENGPSSPYARFFDIEWEEGAPHSAFTVLAPILADHFGRVIEAGELRVVRRGGAFSVVYHDHDLPLSPKTIDDMIGRAARRSGSAELGQIAADLADLPLARLTDARAVEDRHTAKEILARRIDSLSMKDPIVAQAVDAEVEAINSDADRLEDLLRRQNYRLAFWRTGSEELDYRRFFNIETLVALRMEDPQVFEETHRLILRLVDDGTVDGLRIDHIDGLREPGSYLGRLADAAPAAFTIVEKILEADEQLMESWPVAGTTGYDFLIRVNDQFVATENERPMTDIYESFTADPTPYPDVVHRSKMQIMGRELAPEVERLTSLLAEICETQRRHRDHTRRELRGALRELVTHMKVYRTYNGPGQEAGPADRRRVGEAVGGAISCRPDADAELFRFLETLALGGFPGDAASEFVPRLQQLTAPVMAKGVEDTAFYRYHRLISLNEVGGDPGRFGRPAADFHRATAHAATNRPLSMLTLATHDTKRGADARARVNVLSEIPDEWAGASETWRKLNLAKRNGEWPDPHIEYLFYQAIVGAWPADADRVAGYIGKAAKEAKVHTSWADPNEEYERDVEVFVRAALGDVAFISSVESFLDANRIVERGRRNSLAQTVLLLACPGIPDIYQGGELWDLNLVDPDNRRPVDYEIRAALLDRISGARAEATMKLAQTGAPKLWLISKLLEHRRQNPDLYLSSEYDPLTVSGGDGLLAFARGDLAVTVPRRSGEAGHGLGVELPAGMWRDVLTGRQVAGGAVAADRLLADFPAAVLQRER